MHLTNHSATFDKKLNPKQISFSSLPARRIPFFLHPHELGQQVRSAYLDFNTKLSEKSGEIFQSTRGKLADHIYIYPPPSGRSLYSSFSF